MLALEFYVLYFFFKFIITLVLIWFFYYFLFGNGCYLPKINYSYYYFITLNKTIKKNYTYLQKNTRGNKGSPSTDDISSENGSGRRAYHFELYATLANAIHQQNRRHGRPRYHTT